MEEQLAKFDLAKYQTKVTDWAVEFVPKVFLALIILWIGMKIVKRLNKVMTAVLKKSGIDREVEEFLGSIIELVMKGIVILVAASVVGVQFSALFGLIAAAGFAVGLALQGFLGNFASGLTIIFFKQKTAYEV